MDQKELKYLLQRYRMGLCTEKEVCQIRRWYEDGVKDSDWEWTDKEKKAFESGLYAEIQKEMRVKEEVKKRYLFPRVAVAAVLLALIGFGVWFLLDSEDSSISSSRMATTSKEVIKPGRSKATLTLGNGDVLSLDSTAQGVLTHQGKVQISNGDKGGLTYENKGNAAEVVYNTLKTPEGGEYHLTLADGTQIWLNAGSILKYPTTFLGEKREVEIHGEAYFQVAADAERPFIVAVKAAKGKDYRVEVLGTQFNVEAYQEEDIKTTLVSGKVTVETRDQRFELNPGQQVAMNNGQMNVKQVDIEEIIAWKNGYFCFKDESIQNIMEKAARWYSVKISYDHPPQVGFYMKVPRTTSIKDFLRILASTQAVRFNVMGNTIQVSK